MFFLQALADVKRLKSDLLLFEDEIKVLKGQIRRRENEDTSELVGHLFFLKSVTFLLDLPRRLNFS